MNRSVINRGPISLFASIFCFGLAILCLGSSTRGDDMESTPPFAGTYADQSMTVQLSASAGGYTGTITRGTNSFPLTASASGAGIAGSFTASGDKFDFTATLSGNQLSLVSSGRTHLLTRVAANSPDTSGGTGAAPANKEPQAQTVRPAGYDRLNATADGEVFATVKPDAADAKSALESVFPDLARFFGDRPKVSGAYFDTQTHETTSPFAVTYKGQPMRGVVTCTMGDPGAHVIVIYCRADASADAWKKLAAIPTPGGQAAAPKFDLTTYNFPDQTGSIGVAEGWKADAQSIFSTIHVTGPDDEALTLGGIFTVNLPGSRAEALAEHFHQPGFVANFTDPATALQDLWPQVSRANQAKGGPAVRIDRIISVDPVGTDTAQDKSALIVYEITRSQNGVDKRFRNEFIIRIGVTPGGDQWMLTMRGFSAPVEKFDEDAPKMFAMYASLKVNDEATRKVGAKIMADNAAVAAAALEAFKQRGIQQQKDHDAYMAEQDAERDQRNADFAEQERVKTVSSAAEVDSILNRGKVVDTRTGETAKVNLDDMNDVLGALNDGQPGRYQQLQLRDELYPPQPNP